MGLITKYKLPEYDEKSRGKVLGKGGQKVADDLLSIGLSSRKTSNGKTFYWVPFLYRHGLDLTQGKALWSNPSQ